MVGSTGNKRNSSIIGSLMSMPPAKFNSVSRSSAGGTPQKNEFSGNDKIVGKSNAIPAFRKKVGSQPYNKEHIFAGPTSPEPHPDREKRVGSKLHSDPFDGVRQETVKDRAAKRKLTPSHPEKPERSLMKRVEPNISVDKGFVAGSGFVFNGGKRQHPTAANKAKTELWDSRRRSLKIVSGRRESCMEDGASPVKHEIVDVRKNSIKSPTRRDIPDWHDQSNVLPAYKSSLLGGQCLPMPAKKRGPANVHPPWHTSTPRQPKTGSKSGYQPPWHTATPRGAAHARMARLTGRRTIGTPRGRNTPRAIGKRHLGNTAADAPFARAATAYSPAATSDFAREATTPSASPAAVEA